MDDQTPMNYDEEPNGKDQSSSPHSPCKSIHTELKSENKCLLDAKGIHETLDIHQGGGAKESKYYNASVLYLTLHNISIESDGKLQLPAYYAKYHTSETSLKPQSNGPNLVHKQQNSLGSNEKSSDTSDDALSCNILECDDYDDKKETVQHNHKSDSSSPENDKNMKMVSCLKGLDGISANNVAFYAHLAKRELQIIRNSDLEYTKELGHGTYGTVLHRKWKGSDVAIKRMKCTCSSKDEQLVADFWKEAHTLSQLNHPNIVALYGVVTDGPINCLATVTEYVVNGSLKQVLHRKDRSSEEDDFSNGCSICMEYLHGKNIFHFDLKSHNFLVNMRDPQRPVCKIGDLGLSKVKQRTLLSGGVRGTIPWMAPELLSGKDLVSEKVDVFSFGIVMWELLTCEEPYAKMRFEDIIAGIIRGNLRPEIPNWCDPSWRILMERC